MQYACDRDFNGHTHKLSSTFNDDHSTVVQVTNALSEFFAVLHDFNKDIFTWKQHRFHGVGQFVNIEYFYALQLGNTVEVKVVGDNGAMQGACHFDEFAINLHHVLHVGIGDLNRNGGIFLQAVKHLKPAPTAITAHCVSRIGDTLQFVEDEAGDQQRAGDEACLADIGNTPINNGAGIQ